MERIKNFKGQSKISTWLYQVALNTAISFFKRKQKHSHYHAYPKQTADETDILEEKEKQQILSKTINQLSDIDKAIVLLYFENYKYKEISEMLGISENNVAVKLNRIKEKLKSETRKLL